MEIPRIAMFNDKFEHFCNKNWDTGKQYFLYQGFNAESFISGECILVDAAIFNFWGTEFYEIKLSADTTFGS